jgi:hypothetical protein
MDLKKIFFIAAIVLVVTSFLPYTAFAITDKKEIDIEILPNGTLFDVANMKPGDWAPRDITVRNAGKRDFNYSMKIQNDGPEKLFNELMVEVKDRDAIIYTGKISELGMLPKRILYVNTEEKLTITIRFPEHLGNEFQGLGSNFNLQFIAEEIHSNPGGDNPGGENPGEDNPGSDNPGEDGPGGDNPGSDNPSEDDPDGEEPGGDNPEDENTGEDEQESDNPENNHTDEDKEVVEGIIDSGNNSQDGSLLPSTATNIFNFLFFGGMLIVTGAFIILLANRTTKLKRIKWVRK